MSNTKHTPGPWRWEWNGTAGNEYLSSGSMEDGTFKWVGTKEDKLVQAAAPELLVANIKARDAIVDVLGGGIVTAGGSIGHTLREALTDLNLAIAKATTP